MPRKADAKRERIARVIRFPVPLYARLSDLAEQTRRSKNAEVLVALEAHLDREEEANGA